MKHKVYTREKDGAVQAIVSYKYDGDAKWRTKSKQGFKNKSAAKRWATDAIVELAADEGKYAHTKDMTLGDAVDLFLSSKAKLAPNSYIAYNAAMKHLEPFRPLKISDLNPINTQQIADCISKGHRAHINVLWNYLLKMGFIDKKYLELPRKKSNKGFRIFTDEEYQQVLNSSISNEMKVFCQLAHRFGLRAGEILGLTPGNVSKDAIIINRQWARISKDDARIYGFKILKNGDHGIRELPSTPEILALLNSLQFNFREGRYFTMNQTNKINNRLDSLGLEHSVHDFRHTRASEMVHAGFNLKYIAYFLGDTLETIIRTYVHLSEDMKKAENEKFLTHFCR